MSISLPEVLVLGLAAWRLGCLLLFERGPFRVLARAREALGVGHDAEGEPTSWPETEAGRLVRCLDCASVWVGVGLAGLYLLAPRLALVLCLPLALSALAILTGRVVDGARGH